jgi:SAM-dependent methyltransferase
MSIVRRYHAKMIEASTNEAPEFSRVAPVENRHFWFRARARLLLDLIQRYAPPEPGDHLLEVGCGPGHLLSRLERSFPGAFVVGTDLYRQGLRIAHERCHSPVIQADLFRLPFSAQFQLIGLFDVLEHLDDDRAALETLRSHLAPGGTLIVTVPAGPSLWSYFDVASRHRRRYTERQLRDLLGTTGYELAFSTYFMSALVPWIWLYRRVVRGRGPSKPALALVLAQDEMRIIPVLNDLLYAALRLEQWALAAGLRLPKGTSLAAVARRTSTAGPEAPQGFTPSG